MHALTRQLGSVHVQVEKEMMKRQKLEQKKAEKQRRTEEKSARDAERLRLKKEKQQLREQQAVARASAKAVATENSSAKDKAKGKGKGKGKAKPQGSDDQVLMPLQKKHRPGESEARGESDDEDEAGDLAEQAEKALGGRSAVARSMGAWIASSSGLEQKSVQAALRLLEEGNTVPFIARYR